MAKILYEIMLDRFSMLDETVETRLPWRGSPRPCVHAGAFLRLVGIILQYLSHFAMRSGGSTCAPAVPGAYVPYVVVNLRYVWWHMAGVVRANSGAV